LREYDLSEHSIPERRGITHRSEAEGKEKMFLYAHNCYTKLSGIILLCKHNNSLTLPSPKERVLKKAFKVLSFGVDLGEA